MLKLGGSLAHRVVEAGFDGVIRRQGVHPRGQEQVQLLHGELVEDGPQDIRHVLLPQVQAVYRDAVHLIAAADIPGNGLRPVAFGVHGVQQDDEGLSQLLELPDHPLLCLQVVLPGNVGDGAVGGDDNPDGGVLRDHLPGADLRRLRHGNLMIVPGSGHHPGCVVLKLADGPPYHVAYAVDEPHGEGRAVGQLHLGRLLRDELGLRRHDGPAGTALGQLIPGPLLAVYIFNVGNYLGFHEALDEGGLAGPHRAHHADVDIPRRAGGDILIDGRIHSIPSFFRSIFMFPIYARPAESMTARLVLEKTHKEDSPLSRLIWSKSCFTAVL